MKRIKLYIAVPTVGTVVDVQPYMLRELEERYKEEIEFVYPDVCCQRIFHDYARNSMVEDFLATDCDIMWFLDSDVVPRNHTLDLITLYGDQWKVAGCPYPVFMSQPNQTYRQIVFTAYKGTDGKGLCPSRIPYSGIDWVDGLATGCLFIKREVFSQLKKPYFEFKYDSETRALTEGEDLGFCLKLRALGIKFFTDYSMVCKHYKNLDLLELNNYAIDYTNKAVEVYNTQTKKELSEQIRKMMKPKSEPKSKLILPPGLKD